MIRLNQEKLETAVEKDGYVQKMRKEKDPIGLGKIKEVLRKFRLKKRSVINSGLLQIKIQSIKKKIKDELKKSEKSREDWNILEKMREI